MSKQLSSRRRGHVGITASTAGQNMRNTLEGACEGLAESINKDVPQIERKRVQALDVEHEAFKLKLRRDELQQIGASLRVLQPSTIALVDQLGSLIYEAMTVNGFWSGDQDSTPGKIALMHSELSEALEADRKSIERDDKIPEFTGVEAELADTVIRILDFAGRHNLRLGEAIIAKMHCNLQRPFKHDKKY